MSKSKDKSKSIPSGPRTKVLFNQNNFNHNIRPKLWMIKNKSIVIGVGPYRIYKRLMGTQFGIVYRPKSPLAPAYILTIALDYTDIRRMLAQLRDSLLSHDFNLLKVVRHQSKIGPPIPTHVAKQHKNKRRPSAAQNHLDWWTKSPGFPRNLNGPPSEIEKTAKMFTSIAQDQPK